MLNVPQAKRCRILALDDEEHILDLFKESLGSEASANSFDLTLCRHAEEAVEAVRAAMQEGKPFAVAYLDVCLPAETDGVWAAEQIRALDPEIEIVIVTGHSDIDPGEIGFRVGPAHKMLYVPKPFSAMEIKQFAIALGAKWQQERRLNKEIAIFKAGVGEGLLKLNKANRKLRQEIAERKRAERALQEAEAKYRSLVEESLVGVYLIQNGLFVYVNPMLAKTLGYSQDEMIGTATLDYVAPEDRELVTENLRKRIEGEVLSIQYSFRVLHKEGHVIQVEAIGTRTNFLDEPAIIGSLLDLTESKKAEEERDLLEAQLLHAQKMEAIGTLAGGVAHDFNNLLQAIQGYAEVLLLDKESNDPGYHELQEIARAAQRGGEFTQQLLTFSRKVESQRKPLDLNREVQELRRLLERTLPKMIDIELRLAEDLRIVNADPGQMEQLCMNLAVNSRDAMPDGGKLTIETENATLDQRYCKTHLGARPGEYVRLTFSDTGKGMNRETLEHVFEPFYTTKEIGKGTGLGLAMVYGIVKDHGGYITCISEPEEGTTFKIYLPAIGYFVKPSEVEVAEALQGGTETILLVDDEEPIRKSGEELLKRFGYKLLTAADCDSGLALYRQEKGRIDLAILDLIMPGKSGRHCLEGLLDINPRAKVIMASGYSYDGSAEEAIQAGAKGFIRKPYKMRQILHKVREVLDRD